MAKTVAKPVVAHLVQITVDGDVDTIGAPDAAAAARLAEALLSAAERRSTVRVATGRWYDRGFQPTGASVFDFGAVRRVDVIVLADDGSTGSPPIKK